MKHVHTVLNFIAGGIVAGGYTYIIGSFIYEAIK